jgi:hypothetical protein
MRNAKYKRSVFQVLLIAGCLAFLPVLSAESQEVRPQEVVQITPALSKTGYNPGETFQAALILDIMDAYHLNAHTLTNPDMIPTTVKVPDDSPVSWPFIRYPEDLEKAGHTVEGLMDEQYHERVIVMLVGRIPEDAAVGELKAKLGVEYQTCTDTFCLFPVTKPAEITIPVVAPGTEVEDINPEIFGKPPE